MWYYTCILNCTEIEALTHIMPLVSFDTPWKHQKTFGFLFSGGIERDQWHEMGYRKSVQNKSKLSTAPVYSTNYFWHCSFFNIILRTFQCTPKLTTTMSQSISKSTMSFFKDSTCSWETPLVFQKLFIFPFG